MTDNELIAEFMGMVQNPHDPTMFTEVQFYVYEDGQHFGLWRRSAFSTSWDWLMPVVEKIRNLAMKLESKSHHADVEISEMLDAIGVELCQTDIKSAHEKVVEFIKWYNSQNP